jgi:hypothetical protein
LIAKYFKGIELGKTLKVLFGCNQLEYEQFQAACNDPWIVTFCWLWKTMDRDQLLAMKISGK